MHTYLDSTIGYCTSNMVLNILSDTSYLTAPNARSCIGGHFFFGKLPVANKLIFLNIPILIVYTILCKVADSAAEAELGALFHNAKEAKIILPAPQELDHPLLSMLTTPHLLV